MPKFDEDEIVSRIKDGTIAAITLDTSIFHRYGYNLDFTIFASLGQLKDGAVEVVLSDIVVREVIKHISADAEQTKAKLRDAIRAHQKRWKFAFDPDQLLSTVTEAKDSHLLAREQVEAFVKFVGIKLIPASGQTDVTASVIERYFSNQTPFEDNETKKFEFPDAFALLSMEATFRARRKMLLCVSSDKGWQSFADSSDWLFCVSELDKSLSYFNSSGRQEADRAIQMYKAGSAPALADEIEFAIQARLDDNDFVSECDAPLEYESEPTSASLQVVELDSISKVRVVAIEQKKVTFTFEVTTLVSFEAHFSFHVYDRFDKDYVALAETDEEKEARLTLELTVAIDRSLDPEPNPVTVEAIVPRYRVVNFGYIEPFGDEDPTHEKY